MVVCVEASNESATVRVQDEIFRPRSLHISPSSTAQNVDNGICAFTSEIEPRLENLNRVNSNDFKKGKVLGLGSSCVVRKIASNSNLVGLAENDGDSNCRKEDGAPRHVRKGSRDTYVMKTIKKGVRNDEQSHLLAAKDLATEAQLLATIDHPNIIKLRGVSFDKVESNKLFGLVLDRVHETLNAHVRKWKKKHGDNKSVLSLGRLFGGRSVSDTANRNERMAVALDLASALDYLHSRGIMHRDLNPYNIGFDANGHVKLFDFGLAKELDPQGTLSYDTYEVTCSLGGFRYVAPEVFYHQPYNQAGDMYSYGLILWEILSLKGPVFDGFGQQMIDCLVYAGGFRPRVEDVPFEPLRGLVEGLWSGCDHDRPNAATAVVTLKSEIKACHEDPVKR